MRQGGGGQYDLVSASGDASLRLIYGKDVQPVNPALIPGYKDFIQAPASRRRTTRSRASTTGSRSSWAEHLLYNTKLVKPAPTSWAVDLQPEVQGQGHVPDNPIQIADAALYLSKTNSSLGIKDPYELNSTQFNAAITC